jgi:hypothetical protein
MAYNPFAELGKGIESIWKSFTGQGSNFERETFKAEQDWADKSYMRDQVWRDQDINRAQQWRDEDIERNTMSSKVQDYKDAGLHPILATGSGAGGGGIQSTPISTSSGGRVRAMSSPSASPVDIANMGSQMLNDKSTRALENAQARLTMAEAQFQELENKEHPHRRQEEIANNTNQTNLTNAQIKEIQANTNLTTEQIKRVTAEVERFQRDNRILNKDNWLSYDTSEKTQMARNLARNLSTLNISEEDILEMLVEADGTTGGKFGAVIALLKYNQTKRNNKYNEMH